ncbi:MAG: SDR family NAD(P)-dependent oxidoreductase [Candidatus Caenarcaniphilales bacterium]|nr:SDR family NAD(P)-dependent oxidoreductase [Candidatus Caenarcaniphilales bacterium]
MKTALITGGSGDIGAEIAKTLSSDGFQVFLSGRNTNKLHEIAQSLDSAKCSANYFAIDLMKDKSAEELVKEANSIIGPIDILINNAGIYEWGSVDRRTKSLENFQDITKNIKLIRDSFRLNAEIPLELTSLLVPHMKKKQWGRIINIGSISGIVGEPNASIYSSSKASLIGLTKSLGLELAEFGITVNTINPGWVKTDMTNKALEEGKIIEREELETIPQKRWIEPYEIAKMVSYLSSEQAKGITGQLINICAGLSLG